MIIWNKSGEDYTAQVGEIKWRGLDNDYCAIVGDFTLLIYKEQYWNVDVYKGDELLWIGSFSELSSAKAAAEKAYFKHINK